MKSKLLVLVGDEATCKSFKVVNQKRLEDAKIITTNLDLSSANKDDSNTDAIAQSLITNISRLPQDGNTRLAFLALKNPKSQQTKRDWTLKTIFEILKDKNLIQKILRHIEPHIFIGSGNISEQLQRYGNQLLADTPESHKAVDITDEDTLNNFDALTETLENPLRQVKPRGEGMIFDAKYGLGNLTNFLDSAFRAQITAKPKPKAVDLGRVQSITLSLKDFLAAPNPDAHQSLHELLSWNTNKINRAGWLAKNSAKLIAHLQGGDEDFGGTWTSALKNFQLSFAHKGDSQILSGIFYAKVIDLFTAARSITNIDKEIDKLMKENETEIKKQSKEKPEMSVPELITTSPSLQDLRKSLRPLTEAKNYALILQGFLGKKIKAAQNTGVTMMPNDVVIVDMFAARGEEGLLNESLKKLLDRTHAADCNVFLVSAAGEHVPDELKKSSELELGSKSWSAYQLGADFQLGISTMPKLSPEITKTTTPVVETAKVETSTANLTVTTEIPVKDFMKDIKEFQSRILFSKMFAPDQSSKLLRIGGMLTAALNYVEGAGGSSLPSTIHASGVMSKEFNGFDGHNISLIKDQNGEHTIGAAIYIKVTDLLNDKNFNTQIENRASVTRNFLIDTIGRDVLEANKDAILITDMFVPKDCAESLANLLKGLRLQANTLVFCKPPYTGLSKPEKIEIENTDFKLFKFKQKTA